MSTFNRLTRTAALVDVDLAAAAEYEEGTLIADRQGNAYVVLKGVTSVKDAVVNRLAAWLRANYADFEGLEDQPWLDDPYWFWLAFKDLVAYRPNEVPGVACVCFNYPLKGDA